LLLCAALLLSSHAALAQFTQQGNKLVGSGASGAAQQGTSIALSADGNTAIVGGGNDNSNAGAAWVFTRSGGTWTQQGLKLVGSGASGAAGQGQSVALSADGNTAIVGGLGDNSSAGAAWVFTRSGGVWTQQGGKLTGSGASVAAAQGQSVALSADGNTVILGGPFDNSFAGAAWVFTRSGSTWTQQGGKLVGSGAVNSPDPAEQGFSIALSADGNTAILGGAGDNSGAGAVWVFSQPPVVSHVSPNAGPADGGTGVTIVGSRFTGVTGVTFGGAAATDVIAVDDGLVLATAPAHAAGVVDVAVTTPAGTATATGAYTYAAHATATFVGSSVNPSVIGQQVTLTANAIAGSGTPTGTVTFTIDGHARPPVVLGSGQATLRTSALALGSHSGVTATYNGDADSVGSTSAALTQTVTKDETATVVSATPNPSLPGQAMRIAATVAAFDPAAAPASAARFLAPGSATGTVTFKEGSKTLGHAALSAGVAALNLSSLTTGTHTITASYGGASMLAASTSSTIIHISPLVGVESRVNTKTTNAQQLPAVARLASGHVVVWQSNLQDGSGLGIYGQRYGATGAKAGGEFRANTHTAGSQTGPAVAGTSDGGFVVVWQSNAQDGSGLGIYAQRYSKAGAKAGVEFRVNTATAKDQSQPSVAGLTGGGFVIAWQSSTQDGSGLGVYAQHYDASGKAAGVEFRVNTKTAKDQSQPSVAPLANGGFVIVWQSTARTDRGSASTRNATARPV
jgi:hypothetical protein